MLLRSLSAICQTFSSKPTTASDVEPFFVLVFFAPDAASLAAAFSGRPRFLLLGSCVAITPPSPPRGRELEQRGSVLDGRDLVRHPGSRLNGSWG
jgi:hypothetical protein